jgi:hypothetical protein
MAVRIVRRSADDSAWVVTSGKSTRELFRSRIQAEAVSDAILQLERTATGGELRVMNAHGSLKSRRTVDGRGQRRHAPTPQRDLLESAPVELPSSIPVMPPQLANRQLQPSQQNVGGLISEVKSQIDEDGKWADHLLQIGLPLLFLVGGSYFTAHVSPAVADATKEGWKEVYLVTIGFSVTVTILAAFWKAGFDSPPWLAGLSIIAIVVGRGLASLAGEPMNEVSAATTGHPWARPILTHAASAVHTYGVGGALLALGIGIWIGFRCKPIVQALMP